MDNSYLYLKKKYPEEASKLLWGVDDTLEKIMADSIFVLDTQVLLTLYSTSNNSLKEIEQVYLQLIKQKKLYVPGQVIREFVNRRTDLIKDIYKQISERQNKYPVQIICNNYPLLEENGDYKELQKSEKEINEYLGKERKKYNKYIELLKKLIKSWLWNDPISMLYKSLFQNIIYDLEIDETQFIEDWNFRLDHNILPGEKDKSKDNNFDGDLIIWKTILKIGQDNKSNIVFVTGEEKNDWWHKSDKQCLYPRFELMNEFYKASEGHVFQIINLSKLIEHFNANDKAVKEIKGIEDQGIEYNEIINNSKNIHYRAINAVLAWASATYEDASLYVNDIYEKTPSIVLTSKKSGKIGLDVYVINRANFKSGWWFRLCEKLMCVHSDIDAKKYNKWCLFIVTDNSEYLDKILDSKNKLLDFYSCAEIRVGLINNDNRFEQIY